MKKKLIDKLISDDKENFDIYYHDLDDYSYEVLSEDAIKKLLEIKNIKVRFEALTTITHPLIMKSHPSFIPHIFEAFFYLKNPNAAAYLSFACLDEDLLDSSRIKYFTLIAFIMKENNYEKVHHIYNIFSCKTIIQLPSDEYIKFLIECAAKNEYELNIIEEEVYSKYKTLILNKNNN